MSSPRAVSPTETPDTPLTGTTPTASTDGSRVTRQSNFTSNTGGRARQNWRTSISSAVGSLRRSNTAANLNPARLGPISAPIRRQSAGITNESPKDPSLIPSRLNVVELPASPAANGPTTKPDEPRSFLEIDSDDSSEEDRPYTQPIVSRANSVRVQRPKLVQNHSGDHSSQATSGVTIDVYNDDAFQPAVKAAPRPMSTHAEDDEPQPEMPRTPASEKTNESTRGMGPEHAYKALTANFPSPQFVSRFSDSTIESPLPTGTDSPLPTGISGVETTDSTSGLGPEVALKALTGKDGDASATALARVPNSQDVSTLEESHKSELKETIIESPNTTSLRTTLPSPFGGFGAILDTSNRFSPLGLNPVDINAARFHRTISAPGPHHSNRKVTIRPSDLEIADFHGEHRLFRDQVVSTPYPARKGSVANPEEALAGKKLPTLSEEKDRFPSRDRVEVLVLQLAAARHAGMKKTIAVEITDRGTFDDAQLFKAIRKAYSQDLLGLARRVFSARQMSHATFSNDLSFDTVDFIKHLKHPKTGLKRKGWLVWLRQHQPFFTDSPQERKRDSYASYYSPSSIPRTPFQRSLPQPPKVVLHFEFSILAIAMAVLVCVVLSCLATMLWVLLGVPGFDTGSRDVSGRDWRQEAEGRVLTGSVLGILVLSLNLLGSAAWIGGSYVLL
jgi:hypothetical protein